MRESSNSLQALHGLVPSWHSPVSVPATLAWRTFLSSLCLQSRPRGSRALSPPVGPLRHHLCSQWKAGLQTAHGVISTALSTVGYIFPRSSAHCLSPLPPLEPVSSRAAAWGFCSLLHPPQCSAWPFEYLLSGCHANETCCEMGHSHELGRSTCPGCVLCHQGISASYPLLHTAELCQVVVCELRRLLPHHVRAAKES